MLKSLIGVQISKVLHSMYSKGGTTRIKKGGPLLYGFLMIYAVGAGGVMMGLLFSQLLEPLQTAGFMWLYYGMAGLLAFAFSFIMSIFMASSLLYQAKDNELLLSMPIPPWMVLCCRVAVLWLSNFFMCLIVLGPAFVVHCMSDGFETGRLLRFLLGLFTLPFLCTALSCVFGYLVNLVTSRMRRKNIATLIFSLVFLGVYFAVYFRMNQYVQSLIIHSGQIAEALKKGAFPVYHFGLMVTEGGISIVWWLLCALAPFALTIWALQRSFIKLCTQPEKVAKVKFDKNSETRAYSLSQALLRKELNRFTSSANYMLNGSLGGLMAIALPVVMWVKKDSINMIAAIEGGAVNPMYVYAIYALALCFSCGMTMLSASSVSLEGKSYWVLRSLPVPTRDILRAKARCHLLIALPFGWIGSAVACAAAKPDLLTGLALFLLPTAVNLMMAYGGLVFNLRHPRLDWTNEAMVVKQGVPVLLIMLLSFGVNIVMTVAFILWFSHMNVAYYMLIWTLIIGGISYLMRSYMLGKGVQLFERLG